MSLEECLVNDTKIFLVGEEKKRIKRKGFSLVRKTPEIRIFRKDFNHAEIVGEALCSIRNLRCAHFFLIGESLHPFPHWVSYSDIRKSGIQIRLGSYDFRDMENYEYFQVCDIGLKDNHSFLEDILNMAPTEENQNELLNEIEELFALDTFMGQTDRYSTNILFERNKKTGELHLAPLYDFEYSLKKCYMDSKMIYGNFLHPFRTREDYLAFIQEHPEFKIKLKSYLDVDLTETIQRSFRRHGLHIPNSKIPYYKDFEDGRKEFIKSITR